MTERTPSTELTLPNSAVLCEHLIELYGEAEQYGPDVKHARFEVRDLDGTEYHVIVICRGFGATSTYQIHVREVMHGSHESVYFAGLLKAHVTQHIKHRGHKTELPYEWPPGTASLMLHDCIGNNVL